VKGRKKRRRSYQRLSGLGRALRPSLRGDDEPRRDPWVGCWAQRKSHDITEGASRVLHGNTLGVDGGQVSVLEQGDEVSLGGLLKSHDSGGLETQVGLQSHVLDHET